jgi:hypothetical protein
VGQKLSLLLLLWVSHHVSLRFFQQTRFEWGYQRIKVIFANGQMVGVYSLSIIWIFNYLAACTLIIIRTWFSSYVQ